MKRSAAALLAGLWLIGAGSVRALELGDIEVGSLRGEPLMARIPLVELSQGESRDLTVGLGGPEDFERAGIERYDHLVSLRFEVVAEGAEAVHVMITGREPIDSPFTTFLVEAVWPGGRTLREYTVLLDAAPPRPAAIYGPVRATDTLWSLAGRYRPEGISVQRMMLAMLTLNPHAFSIANVNALRAGAMLEIPSSDRIGPDEKTSAIQEVRHQNEAWQVYFRSIGGQADAAGIDSPETADPEAAAPSPGPAPEEAVESRVAAGQVQDAQVRVVVPDTGETTDADQQQKLRAELDLALEEADSKRQEIFELSDRLDEAERLIADLQRLVELKDDDIAGLQTRLAAEAAAARQEAGGGCGGQAGAWPRLQAQAGMAAQAQAEAAARAQEEARIQGEAAAAAESRTLAEADSVMTAQTDVPEPASAAPPPEPPLPEAQQEADSDSAADPATMPAALRNLEDMLGFSPVVGGVGLVGVILILGGLIALMRRRGSASDDLDEEVASAEDEAASDFWGDETDFEEEGAGFDDDDAYAPPEKRASGEGRQPAGTATETDDFDIGIDLDEKLTRSVEEELEPASEIEGRPITREGTPAPAGDRAVGRSPARSDFGSLPGAESEFVSGTRDEGSSAGLEGRYFAEADDVSPAPGHERQSASTRRSNDDEAPLESVAAFAAGEGLSGDVDELQTKLDLAQTYIDMEDFESARALLREVQAEGGLEQRAIARYLAGKLP